MMKSIVTCSFKYLYCSFVIRFKRGMLSMVLPECNSMGLALLPGKSFEDLFELAENKEIDYTSGA